MTPPHPKALTILWDGIPQELIRHPQWVCWRYELDQKNKQKWTKVPRQTNGKNADATEPWTWADFPSTRGAYEGGRHAFDGVGIVFAESDEYAGVDLDGCINEAGEISPQAWAIIRKLNSYTETSPSGTGVKIWVKARLPDDCGHSTTKVVGYKKFETYDRGRYFTVTGRHLDGTPTTIESRQEELLAVHAEVFADEGKRAPPPPPREPVILPAGVGFPGADDELIAAIRRSSGGRKFASLFDNGDVAAYDGDDSAADMALCGIFVWWCGPDEPRIERLFSMSKLGEREKWRSIAASFIAPHISPDSSLGSRTWPTQGCR